MQYKIGTVSVTNGSNVVTGTGTAWQASGIDSSNIFTKEGDNVAYSIASVDSDTQLTLTANYGGSNSSGSNYGITIDFTTNGLPLLSSGDLNTDAIYNEAMLIIANFNNSLGNAAFDDKTTPSATIWDSGNLKPNYFYGNTNEVIATGVATSSTGCIFYFPAILNTRATSLILLGSFKVFNRNTGLTVATGITSLSITSISSRGLTALFYNFASGINAGDNLELRCDENASSITIE